MVKTNVGSISFNSWLRCYRIVYYYICKVYLLV